MVGYLIGLYYVRGRNRVEYPADEAGGRIAVTMKDVKVFLIGGEDEVRGGKDNGFPDL